MLTVETITDDQIEAEFRVAKYGSEMYRLTLDALSSLDALSLPARARLVEILNARNAKGTR